jgi:hypothetical protein
MVQGLCKSEVESAALTWLAGLAGEARLGDRPRWAFRRSRGEPVHRAR